MLVVFAIVAACTTQPVLLPSRDFDRPTDVTFVCLGTHDSASSMSDGGADASDAASADPGTGPIVSGQPMRVCHPRGKIDVASPNNRTFAFLPNSSSGELSVVDADNWKLVNLDPANPGYNRLPLGILPSQIAASDDGCRLVTANHGSCDLSVVDPAALLAPTLATDHPGLTTGSASSQSAQRVFPRTKSGKKLNVFAGEIAFLPLATDMTGAESLCSTNPNFQWQALATFPSCDLVALIDLPSGVIRQAAHVMGDGAGGVSLVPLADGEEPACLKPDCTEVPGSDAGADSGAAPDADAGAAEAGAAGQGASAPTQVAGSPALRPGPIAIIPGTGRAYVGLANAPYVLAFNVKRDELTVDTAAIQLHEGALGVNRVRLSIDPYKDKTIGTNGIGTSGAFVGDDAHPGRDYLYVIARDGSLRVVQANAINEYECETNRDFGAITDATTRRQAMDDACLRVDPTMPRRPSAIGPGIRLPTPPIDVAVADVRPTPDDRSETSVSGAHAWVLTASGVVYLLNIDPVTRNIFWVDQASSNGTLNSPAIVRVCATPSAADCHAEEEPAPNSLRNRNFVGYTLALDPSSGLPRLDIPVSQASIGPRIESIWTQGTPNNATALSTAFLETQVFFPDPPAVTAQSWSVTWEGSLMSNPRLSGQLKTDTTSLQDLGMDFCRLGVIPNDLVTLTGCTDPSQCGIGKTCVLGSNGALGAGGLPINGLCLSATSKTARGDCDELLSTVKRYDVASTSRDTLALRPHKDELVRPDLKPCVIKPPAAAGADGGTDAKPDAAAATRDASAGDAADARDGDASADGDASLGVNDCVNLEDPTTNKFVCVAQRSSTGSVSNRCLYPCEHVGKTDDCRAGRICIDFDDSGTKHTPCANHDCFCADGPELASLNESTANECLGELFPYEVGVGRGFVVSGSQSALPATMTADANGLCVPLTDSDPRDAFRIPMNAPPMSSIVCANNLGEPRLLDSRCDPNDTMPSCGGAALTTAGALLTNATTTGTPNACQFMGGPNETDPLSQFPEHVHALFRNREVQFMMTNLDKPPSGVYQIHFDVHGGFQPQTVAIPSTVEVSMPARIVLGPFDSNPQTGTITGEVPYLFVVDQRRLGRSQGGGPTRGQLLRIHPRGLPVANPVAGAQPWFEDLTHSANQFPIQ
jgi:hypothetical protein